jgi:hypothetical protein
LVPPILKPFDFGFSIFFQIQKLLGVVLKVDSIPCTLPQLLKIVWVMKFYNKIKHESI